MIATTELVSDDWARISARDCPLILEERAQPLAHRDLAVLLAKAPFVVRAEGEIETLPTQLADLPKALIADILALGQRFADLTGNSALRVRVEGITTDACRKVHADYTDLRLITTYAGPGTDYVPPGDEGCCLERMKTGWIGLFKGRLFAPGHAPCMHRSPPIESKGETRLVLVIDTPAGATANLS